jgi:hypothetical protein
MLSPSDQLHAAPKHGLTVKDVDQRASSFPLSPAPFPDALRFSPAEVAMAMVCVLASPN